MPSGTFPYNYPALVRRVDRSKQNIDQRTDPSSHTSFCHLTTPEKVRHFQREHELRKSCQWKVTQLKEKLELASAERGVTGDDGLHKDLSAIM